MRFDSKGNCFVLFAILVTISFLAPSLACAQSEETPAASATVYDPYWRPTLAGEFMGEVSQYLLGQNDVVKILVRNQPELSGDFVIGPDGSIQYAFVGDIKAEGLTKEQLKEKLTIALERYVKGAEINISIAAYRSKFVYVIGEVGRPGKFPMVGDSVSLREAVVAAGLPTDDAALRRVHVITPDEKKPTLKKVDLYAVLYQGKLDQNVLLRSGDVVVVSTTIPAELAKALRKLLSPFNRVADIDDFSRMSVFQ